MESLLQFLNAIHPLSKDCIDYLSLVVKAASVIKKEYILKRGMVCGNIYFVERGLFRCYHIDEDTEVCTRFFKEGDNIFSKESFCLQQQSKEWIQALEDSELYYISYKELQHIYQHFAAFSFISIELMKRYYHSIYEREQALRFSYSHEKILWMEERHPDLIKRLKNKDIAAYLGFTPENITRFRKERMIL